jgi:hypothetical protein
MKPWTEAEIALRAELEDEIWRWEEDGASTPLLVSEVDDLAARVFAVFRESPLYIDEEKRRHDTAAG